MNRKLNALIIAFSLLALAGIIAGAYAQKDIDTGPACEPNESYVPYGGPYGAVPEGRHKSKTKPCEDCYGFGQELVANDGVRTYWDTCLTCGGDGVVGDGHDETESEGRVTRIAPPKKAPKSLEKRVVELEGRLKSLETLVNDNLANVEDH